MPSSAWNRTRESVDTTRAGLAAAGASPGGSAPNSVGAAVGGATSRACGTAASMPRSKVPWAGSGQHLPRPLQQDPQLGLGVRRSHVRHDLAPAAVVLGDLHGRCPRCRPHPPNPRHGTEPRAPLSA